MTQPSQSSFRRTLLARILLLSIPVLLTGELVAYHKARSSFLETARRDLTASAVSKGENIRNRIEALRSHMVTASDSFTSQLGTPQPAQAFVNRLHQALPQGVQCIQMTNLQTRQIEGSTCGKTAIAAGSLAQGVTHSQFLTDPLASVRITPVTFAPAIAKNEAADQLDLIFSVPVFDRQGQNHYILNVQTALNRFSHQSGLPHGDTVVLDQDGTILAHPKVERVGRNIRQEADPERLQEIVAGAIAGKQDALRLWSLEANGAEWLVGYSPTEVMIAPGKKHVWVILAVTPLDNVLAGLEDIKQVLFILTLGLLGANLLATIYIARDLALPLEQLGRYALQIYHRQAGDRAPKNFRIREINQLAEALDNMVDRLEDRAEELETAWQEALAANQLKSDFLATTSHELRTPLNAIIGCVRLVKDGCCDNRDEELEFLQQADDAAIHLLKIINDLLDIAKIEAGKVELNLQSVSIQDLCEQCLRMIQPGAEKKHLDLSLNVDQQLHRIPLDERRVRQMVINLLSNAVKFTPEGGHVKLSGWTCLGYHLSQDMRPDHSPINPNTPYLCLEVTDSGIGIPRERWHLLFRPFQQIDSSLTRKHEGTGLGLALTKRLAELHGGTISFRSAPDEGSTFRIWLPSRDSQPAYPLTDPDVAPAQLSVDARSSEASSDTPEKPIPSIG